MSLLQATLVTAVATAVLALLAIVIAFFAILALRRQSAEVAALQRQVRDQQDLIRQQRQHFEQQVEELKAFIAERQQKAIEEWIRKQQWPHLQLQSSRSSPREQRSPASPRDSRQRLPGQAVALAECPRSMCALLAQHRLQHASGHGTAVEPDRPGHFHESSLPPGTGSRSRTLSPMSLIAAAQWTAVATIALAAFAIVAAWYARRAFLKQSEEVRTLKDQLKDQQDLNAKQTPVLELQARELEASLAQRNDQAEAERRAQANRVAAWFALQEVPVSPQVFASSWGAIIRNDSDLPILDVRVSFHFIATASPASSEWRPVFRGSPAERVRVIPPHFEKFVEIPADVRNKHSEVSDDIYVVSFEFTDAAGNHWERDPRGALKDA